MNVLSLLFSFKIWWLSRRQWWEVLRIERRCLQQVVVTMVGESERAEEISVGRELVEDWDERGQASGGDFGGFGWVRDMRELWCGEQRDERQKAEAKFGKQEGDVVYDRGWRMVAWDVGDQHTLVLAV